MLPAIEHTVLVVNALLFELAKRRANARSRGLLTVEEVNSYEGATNALKVARTVLGFKCSSDNLSRYGWYGRGLR